MVSFRNPARIRALPSLAAELARDRAGNTLALMAAATLPLLALVGGGVDMGRSYLSQSRLQQACDAGVLAARKKLGSTVATTGVAPPNDVDAIGKRFFNVNFRDGSYGTSGRNFAMVLEPTYAISGTASVNVPTTVMNVFGYTQVPITVTCEAKLNFSNTDVMFVLDTTGSMADSISGVPKIDALRTTVRNFHDQLEATKGPGTTIRYGFLPYSTNVNVGYLLKSDWMVDRWTYPSREAKNAGSHQTNDWYSQRTDLNTNYTYIAAHDEPTCPTSTANDVLSPAAAIVDSNGTPMTVSFPYVDANGYTYTRWIRNGIAYTCTASLADSTKFTVTGTNYNNYIFEYKEKDLGTKTTVRDFTWRYRDIRYDVRSLKAANGNDPYVGGKITDLTYGYPDNPQNMDAWFRGCVEERKTYEITDYANVDFNRAMDLDIDTPPTPGVEGTQWRPMLGELAWARGIDWWGNGTFSKNSIDMNWDYLMPQWAGLSACPAPARKLAQIGSDATSLADLDAYLASLTPNGSTYHDIGMIWGGRLLSPTGLFASENADQNGQSTNRNLIFLTDGQTAPLDISYSSYGIEPINTNDNKRYTPPSEGGALTLTQVVEQRFLVACAEVKKRNITIWVVAFGTQMSPIFTQCADSTHTFSAGNASQLNTVFSHIADSMGDLRITK